MSRSTRLGTIAIVTAYLVLTGCSQRGVPPPELPPVDRAQETTTYIGVEVPVPPDTTAPAPERAAFAALAPSRGSDLHGRAELGYAGDRARIEVELLDADDVEPYTAGIHRGSCRAPGVELASLASFDATDPRRSSTHLDALEIVLGDLYAIVIRTGDGAVVACGELRPLEVD